MTANNKHIPVMSSPAKAELNASPFTQQAHSTINIKHFLRRFIRGRQGNINADKSTRNLATAVLILPI